MALSEKECYNMSVSISKALNSLEQPMKMKHARATIIGTFHTLGAHTFWAIILKQPLQENRITAWKFCHLLHKVMREGHQLCIQHSLKHRTMLTELGKLWGHLNDGYGPCIKCYTKVLVTKLNFHERNIRIPGNLQLKRGELSHMAANDINFYFQLAVEMFDYLDDILQLQSVIFNSISHHRVNSMTPSGQCRLLPLIPLIQDSNQLYDLVVRVMFKLHLNLSNELLFGHRDRFRQIFTQMKQFFKQSSELQYFVNLISIPHLPDSLPNFLCQSDFGTYISPIVVVPEPDTESIVSNLIDTSEPETSQNHHAQQANESRESDLIKLIKDKEDLIKELQFEIERINKIIKSMTIDKYEMQAKFQDKIAELNSDITAQKEELVNVVMQKDELETKLKIEAQETSADEKVKLAEEKFAKLKMMYTSIRNEHIALLRQTAELTKTHEVAKNELEKLTKEKYELDSRHEERLQQAEANSRTEVEFLKKQLTILESENKTLKSKVDLLESNKSDDIVKLNSTIDELNNKIKEQHDNFIESESSKLENIEKLKFQLNESLSQKQSEIENLQILVHTNEEKYEMEKSDINAKCSTERAQLMESLTNYVTVMRAVMIMIENQLKCEYSKDSSLIIINDPQNFIYYTEELEKQLNILPTIMKNYIEPNVTASACHDLFNSLIPCTFYFTLIRELYLFICHDLNLDLELIENARLKMNQFSHNVISFYRILTSSNSNYSSSDIEECVNKLKESLAEIVYVINSKLKNPELINVENELAEMDKTIEDAAKKIEMLLSQTRSKYTGIKLEVNEQILDACNALMESIRMLVKKSRILQGEIVSCGKGTTSAKEFYKKNHKWSEGLISAAKNVAQGANFLVDAANKAVSGDGKQTDLIVAAQEISASTTQLVIASRVKATPGSTNLIALGDASKSVNQATGAVVAVARNNSQILEEFQDMDLSQLTVHQAKKLEMEIQVKVIELTQALEKERFKLASFRKQNYQAAV